MLGEVFLRLLYPPRCILCDAYLHYNEVDMCRSCREKAPEYPYGLMDPAPRRNSHLHFLDSFTAVWYYEEDVRQSLHRYKFCGEWVYARPYGRLLAMRIQEQGPERFDYLTWVPVSSRRKAKRGYDQSKLLAYAVGRELGIKPVRLLKKIRDNPPQSGVSGAPQRKANVLGAYRVFGNQPLNGKTVLLLDDIFTTGATAEECARVLLTAGAEHVFCAAMAAVRDKK